jgi:hypothetical protein
MWIPPIRRHVGLRTFDRMEMFVVERFLVDWSVDEIDALVHRINEAASRLAEHGVRHLESIFITADETCLSLFEGPDANAVLAANRRCSLPTGRVLGAVTHRSNS